jgi:hypothetical protein
LRKIYKPHSFINGNARRAEFNKARDIPAIAAVHG